MWGESGEVERHEKGEREAKRKDGLERLRFGDREMKNKKKKLNKGGNYVCQRGMRGGKTQKGERRYNVSDWRTGKEKGTLIEEILMRKRGKSVMEKKRKGRRQ